VSETRIDSITVVGPIAKAYLSYHRLGFAQGNPAGFTEAVANTHEVIEMVHLADGWWINRYVSPHPVAATVLRNFDWPDSLRVLIEGLAKSRLDGGSDARKGTK